MNYFGAVRDTAVATPPRILPCQVCGGSSRLALTQNGDHRLDFYLCRHCGLLFVGTDVADEDLAQAYKAIDMESYYDAVDVTCAAKAEGAVEDLREIVPESSVVVDFGCGGGHLLRAVAEGTSWSATGFDLDRSCVELCRRAGLDATDHLVDVPKADVVTMLDVAEHVKDPSELFRVAARLTDPKGLLYLHTPRRCLWDTLALHMLRFRLLQPVGASWLSLRVSIYHLRLWSDTALEVATRRSGFRIISYRRELELGWPIALYAEHHLADKWWAPAPVVRAATALTRVVASCRLMRNKAILTAELAPVA